MSTKTDIAKILQQLEIAYPGYKTDKSESIVDLWFETLGGYPTYIIRGAADMIIENSKYFPSLNEFLSACKTIERPIPIDPTYSRLLKRRTDLENRLYEDGITDPEEWKILANDFEALDKPHAAERCRQRAEIQQ